MPRVHIALGPAFIKLVIKLARGNEWGDTRILAELRKLGIRSISRNTVMASQMWTHPHTQEGLLVLDLGRECIVAGVRIWNLNEPNGTHRGWKETTIHVGSSPTSLATPGISGLVPQAPGTANAPDYSTTIPIPFVRGRYVRLQANSVWRQDDHMGPTEVQVLGFEPPQRRDPCDA